MLKEINFLQLFAEEEENGEEGQQEETTKALTQEEVDKIVQERVSRARAKADKEYADTIKKLTEQVEGLQKDKDFKDLSAEERAKEERKLEAEKYQKETQELKETIAKLERESRHSEE